MNRQNEIRFVFLNQSSNAQAWLLFELWYLYCWSRIPYCIAIHTGLTQPVPVKCVCTGLLQGPKQLAAILKPKGKSLDLTIIIKVYHIKQRRLHFSCVQFFIQRYFAIIWLTFVDYLTMVSDYKQSTFNLLRFSFTSDFFFTLCFRGL